LNVFKQGGGFYGVAGRTAREASGAAASESIKEETSCPFFKQLANVQTASFPVTI
jgi:hypothetical protein